MTHDLIPTSASPSPSRRDGDLVLPAMITEAGAHARRRFIEFCAANIRNKNTRAAYLQAVTQVFDWCEDRKLHRFEQLQPVVVAAYIEKLGAERSKPTVKQHLAAIRMLFDW